MVFHELQNFGGDSECCATDHATVFGGSQTLKVCEIVHVCNRYQSLRMQRTILGHGLGLYWERFRYEYAQPYKTCDTIAGCSAYGAVVTFFTRCLRDPVQHQLVPLHIFTMLSGACMMDMEVASRVMK